jgi:PAS domain S-box-containing protein
MLPTSGLLFAVYYVRKQHWLKPQHMILLAICTLAPFLLIMTNEIHHLFWTYRTTEQGGAFSAFDFTPAIGFWVFSIYARIVIVFTLILFITEFIRSRGIYRKRVGMVIVSIVAPAIANVIYDVARHVVAIESFPQLDLTPFGLVITCLMLTWAIFRLRLGDIIPIANAAITEGMSDLIVVLDSENRIVRLNPAAQSLVEQPFSEVVGRPAKEVFAHLNGALDFSKPESLTDREIALGEGNDQCTYDTKLSPISDENGSFLGTVIVLRDISERKRMEQELIKQSQHLEEQVKERTGDLTITNEQLRREITERERAQERLNILFQFAPDAYYLTDLEGTFIDGNKAAEEMTGYDKHELIGQSFLNLNLLSPEELQKAATLLAGNASSNGTGPDEFTLNRKDGSQVSTEIRTFPVRIEDQLLVLGIARDITERKNAEEERHKLEAQVQHTQKLESLGVLAGGIAHDFNNLLTGVLGNAQLGLMNLSTSSPARKNIEEIEKASERAADLCNQMLAYSGKGRFVIEPINLNEIIDEMTHLLELSKSKKAALRFNFADDLPAIEADATQIRQVVMNLITNASEAIGDENGVIMIATGAMECEQAYLSEVFLDEELEEGTYAYVEVSDSGYGMEKETANRIFDPFFTTKFTGRGLGLAAVLGIVRGHKGAIKIYTEPGKGTTFKILFPAIDKAAGSIRKEQVEDVDWCGSGTVLLADDEDIVRATGESMLEELGFTVLLAEDGREAIDIYRDHASEVVLVVLDLTMPNVSGEEAFSEIRRVNRDARIILSSGYNEQEVSNRFVGKGLAGFIQKPYRYEALRDKVREAFDNHQKDSLA